jgi:hypothetical protein
MDEHISKAIEELKKPTKPKPEGELVRLKKKAPKAIKEAKVKVAKVKASKKDTSAPCACQCGGVAKGGGFLPGHDSKLAGAIKRVLAGKPFEGERAYVTKVAKSEHPALISGHFRHLFDQLSK